MLGALHNKCEAVQVFTGLRRQLLPALFILLFGSLEGYDIAATEMGGGISDAGGAVGAFAVEQFVLELGKNVLIQLALLGVIS